MTVAQEQAVEAATSYLETGGGFSRAGLINQLSSSAGEGFPKAVAIFAVNHVDVDWTEQAIESAMGYLETGGGFSRAGLINQLSSSAGEGFPKGVAIFAVNHLRVNWNQQAVKSAKGYLETGGGFSRAGLIQQLSSSVGEGFTYAQAVYAANKVGLR
jgi:hypothetical protein